MNKCIAIRQSKSVVSLEYVVLHCVNFLKEAFLDKHN